MSELYPDPLGTSPTPDRTGSPLEPPIDSPIDSLRVIYINLDRRPDRRAAVEAELERVGFPRSHIIRFPAIAHPTSPNAGCNLSHAAAIRMAGELGLEAALILEDDFQFIDDAAAVRAALAAFLGENTGGWEDCRAVERSGGWEDCRAVERSGGWEDCRAVERSGGWEDCRAVERSGGWDAALLTTTNAKLQPDPDAAHLPWQRCLSASNAAGYLVHRRQMAELSRLIHDAAEHLAATGKHWHYQNDVVWCECMQRGRWFAFCPRLGFQRPGYSDLAQREVDYR
jgi:hypothetical protein